MTILIKGRVKTDIQSSECEFELTLPDNATEDEIDFEVRQSALNLVEWWIDSRETISDRN